jgi:arginine repressor
MQRLKANSSAELITIERMVTLTNALIELQRELIEHLDYTGFEITSAKRDFDELLVVLASWVQQRERLRQILAEREVARGVVERAS